LREAADGDSVFLRIGGGGDDGGVVLAIGFGMVSAAPHLPSGRRGVKPRRNREVISGIIHVQRVGCRWRGRPMAADAAHQASNMAAHFLPGRRLARAQQDRHRACSRGVVDMDRQEAALVVERIEQRELLMPVHDVDGVVDVQRNCGGRTAVAGAVEVDHGVGHAHHLAQVGRVLPARHGRLRAQVAAAVREPPAGQLEAGIVAHMIEVVGILVAAGDGEHAGAQDVGDTMRDEQGIAWIGDQPREPLGDPQAPLGGCQQQNAAIRGDASAVERSSELLASDGWKAERLNRIVAHGGCGSACSCEQDGYDTQSINIINSLRDTRQPNP
jgi:hypothetical protein